MNTSKPKITFVMTSCNRFDLLSVTLRSFLKCNTYPIEQYIFIEDSEKIAKLKKTIAQFPKVYEKALLLHNSPKLGQIKSIDRAYDFIKTEYIFHCEEDWEFYRPDFIENSIAILQEKPKIINLWLRELNDTNGHPFHEEIYTTQNDLSYHQLTTNYLQQWHGFTFNPTVKRLSDYRKIAPYQNIGHEKEIGKAYFKLGYKGAIFLKGAVKHLGWHRRVLDVDKKRPRLILMIDAWFKKKKAFIYKALGIFGKKYKS